MMQSYGVASHVLTRVPKPWCLPPPFAFAGPAYDSPFLV